MKIGLVSAKKHCKTHMQALRGCGYDITALGARPKSIPSSYDVLIVRVASTSHEGEATARAWMRQTGKPAIYENGLSGIRRELSTLTKMDDGDVVCVGLDEDISTAAARVKQTVRNTLQMCSDTYIENRPKDGPEDLTRALNTLLHENYPDRARQLASMIPSIVASAFPYTEHTEHTEQDHTVPDNTPIFAYTGTADNWPSDDLWASVWTERKARVAYHEGMSIIKRANHMAVSSLQSALGDGNFSRRVKATWLDRIAGKPLTAAYIFVTLHPEITKTELQAAYKSITGKGTDSRIIHAVRHSLGAYCDHRKQTADRAVLDLPPVVESNTQAILEVMEDLSAHKSDLSAHKSKVQGVCDRLRQSIRDQSQTITALESKLDEAIKAGFDPRTNLKLAQMEKQIGDLLTTQLQNHKHEVNRTLDAKVKVLDDSHREVFKVLQNFGSESGAEYLAIESRVKDLEGCWDALNGQVPTLIGQAAGAVEHRLRSDISNAFDALAAEQPSGDLSSNPFAALEQVKAALKAAGFKGTLTLTIE